uniref:7TM_GPCR_Srx domain-containing protein n=1 Tax=Heterorhabditis bacteriophora TaxID=37862 RepID=A0A1I7X1L1_HETBA
MLDGCSVIIILLDMDHIIFPIRGINFFAVKSGFSLLLSIFYFMCIWLCINATEIYNRYFTVAAVRFGYSNNAKQNNKINKQGEMNNII